jgi:parallel beta-helix repeat protein
MKRIRLIAWVLAAVACVAVAGLGASRGPITILGNSDFTEENGVLSGSGTAADPYVIAGWEIGVPPGASYGVQIENVTAAFVLRGLVLNGAGEVDGAAIRIAFAAGGTIEDCTIASSVNGIEIASSTDVALRDNVLYVRGIGLRVTGESPSEYRHAIEPSNQLNDLPIHYYYGLDGDRIEGVETRHLMVAASRNVTVVGNSVLDGDGIQLAYVTDSTVIANVAGRDSNVLTEHAIRLYESDRNVVAANLVKNTRLAGILLSLSSENEIDGNRLGVCDTGIWLIGGEGNTIAENELLGCFTAVWLAGGTRDNSLSGNVVVGKLREDGDRRQGLLLDRTSGNRIERNGLTECEIGVTVEAQATGNRFVSNTIVAGAYGILLAGSYNDFEGNLVTQQSQGILFAETRGQSIARGNRFTGNVLADNNQNHLYTSHDCESNVFTENVFLDAKRGGTALVLDYGTGNRWSDSGIGNYWGDAPVEDADGDGIGDAPITVYPAAVQDDAPLASIVPAELRVGVLGTLPVGTVRVERSDGTTAEVDARIAETFAQRWIGFRGFPASLLDGSPGILFVFEAEDELRFTMATVPFDLDIAFFDAAGDLVGSATMTALSSDLYTASEPFQYALELPSGDLEERSIGEGATLILPAGD